VKYNTESKNFKGFDKQYVKVEQTVEDIDNIILIAHGHSLKQ
jgi:hypothetical protein